ncbi:MAG TPA: RecX family transcriptional regulator [Allosphingosinicella sp.]|nr:RecX family transcriptional regulator [Allosphingosinicella sp.]
MKAERNRKPAPPLDPERLERLALFYAGRYATTRAKLAAYLQRKVKERGWEGEGRPEIERLVERFSALGYVNDKAFATSKAASLQRRGYGERRLDQALYVAGIEAEDASEAKEQARRGAWESAIRFAERKRLGPFANIETDGAGRQKALAAMLRAGHPLEIARTLVAAPPGAVPKPDET